LPRGETRKAPKSAATAEETAGIGQPAAITPHNVSHCQQRSTPDEMIKKQAILYTQPYLGAGRPPQLGHTITTFLSGDLHEE